MQKSSDRPLLVSYARSRRFGHSIATCAKRRLSSSRAHSHLRPTWRCVVGRAGVASARRDGLLRLLLLPDPVLHQHIRLYCGGFECRQGGVLAAEFRFGGGILEFETVLGVRKHKPFPYPTRQQLPIIPSR